MCVSARLEEWRGCLKGVPELYRGCDSYRSLLEDVMVTGHCHPCFIDSGLWTSSREVVMGLGLDL